MWIGLLIAIIAVICLWIAFPFFKAKEAWSTHQQLAAIDQNLQAREHLMRLLKDLEVEHEVGGIETAEFEKLQSGYLNEAVLLGRRLKALRGEA